MVVSVEQIETRHSVAPVATAEFEDLGCIGLWERKACYFVYAAVVCVLLGREQGLVQWQWNVGWRCGRLVSGTHGSELVRGAARPRRASAPAVPTSSRLLADCKRRTAQ